MLGLTISRRAIQVPTKRFATRSISRPTVSFRPRTSPTSSDSAAYPVRPSLQTAFTRCFHHETVCSSPADAAEGSSDPKEGEKRVEDLSRYVVVNTRHRRGGQCQVLHSDERYMVARILIGTTMSIITRMDNPQWFKENAESHVFSQERYDKIVEDLKALGTEDSNAVQALVCDTLFLHQSTSLISDRKGMYFGRLKRLNTRSMRRPC